jgi:hypothetical protein
MQKNSTLSLGNSTLFISTLSLNANLKLDIDFENGQGGKIYASSVTIFVGNNLIINKSTKYELFSYEVPIIMADDFFGLNQNGSFTNNAENIFNYDKSLYDLRFDSQSKTLYIKNIVPEDQGGAETDNEKEIEDIINEDGRLKYPISKMNDNQKRFAYDSLSGVFLANIFTSLLYANNEDLTAQIFQTPARKPWINVNYSNLEFDRAKQTLNVFQAQTLQVTAGGTLFANKFMGAGVFAGVLKSDFNQANNTADIFEANAGVYSNISLNDFNAIFLASFRQGAGGAVREINLDKLYHVKSAIFFRGFNGAANLEYKFLLNRSKKIERRGGPFVLYEFNQAFVDEIKENEVEGDNLASLYFRPQIKQKHALKGGLGFSQKSAKVQLTAHIFGGQNLNDTQKFNAEFIENEGEFRVKSDDENLFFYGVQIGADLNLSRAITMGARFGFAFNENLRTYNASINIIHKLPKRIKRPAVPVLTFIENSANLTKADQAELARFALQLKAAKPKFKRILISVRLNNSQDDLSIAANKLALERANAISRRLRSYGIPPKKISFGPRKVMLRDKIEVRIER